MNADEALVIWGMVNEAFPAQKMGELTPDMWAKALDDIDYRDACAAVISMLKQQSFLSVAELRDEVKRIRAERIRAVNTAVLDPHDADPDDVLGYNAAKRQRINAIASGRPVPIEPVGQADPERVEQAMNDALAQLPKMPRALPQADIEKKRADPRTVAS